MTAVKRALVLIGFAFAIASPAAANDFPTRPVTMVVPFAPGGSSDQAARPLANALSRIWGQPVVIVNKPGAGSGVGMAATAEARPDGYTIVLTNPGFTLLPATDALFDRKPLFSADQFVPLARVAAEPTLLVVTSSAPWNTLQEFVAEAKKRPSELSYGSSGTYGAGHVPVEMVAHAADIKLNHVAYTGGGPALTATLGNEVNIMASAPTVFAGMIKGGQLRPLAVTGSSRLPLLPEVPTAIELGYDVEFYIWAGLFAPSKVTPDVVKLLREGIAKAVQDPEYRKNMDNLGLPVAYLDGPEFAKYLASESEDLKAAINQIGKVE